MMLRIDEYDSYIHRSCRIYGIFSVHACLSRCTYLPAFHMSASKRLKIDCAACFWITNINSYLISSITSLMYQRVFTIYEPLIIYVAKCQYVLSWAIRINPFHLKSPLFQYRLWQNGEIVKWYRYYITGQISNKSLHHRCCYYFR